MNTAIIIENLSKRYQRLTDSADYATVREKLMNVLLAPFRRWRAGRVNALFEPSRDFWALRDVNFDVPQGQAVGIIGRNGAGKSTLLKILSRITKPTLGEVRLRGRVGSLLEVGTGFHPELTGRENIFLNGAILGMRRHEIQQKFDQIVDFAEIEPFLDTPVKRYSSGMYVRLAFAVAAHLEPEILIVDEVLAVGDAQFQRKCMGKMESVAENGRAVLLVSHQMAAIKALCSSGVLLKTGCVQTVGPVAGVVDCYLREGLDPEHGGFNRSRRLAQSRECEILDAWLTVDGS